jgi:hypothetical protein
LTGEDLLKALTYLEEIGNERKLRLLACACCRLTWDQLDDERSREIVRLADRWADGLATHEDCLAAIQPAREAWNQRRRTPAAVPAYMVMHLVNSDAYETAGNVAGDLEDASGFTGLESLPLLRHILGNPFRLFPPPPPMPEAVYALARSLYDGDSCCLALHDALTGANQPSLAEHFRDPNEWHPKGCWALDLILGKS